MKSKSLTELIIASEGPFEEPVKHGFGKFVLGLVAGAAITVSSLYLLAGKSEPESPKASVVAENPAEKSLLDEISRYKSAVLQKDSELSKSGKELETYRKRVSELEALEKNLKQSIDAQKGSDDKKNAEISRLAGLLETSENKSKELSQKIAEYEKSVGSVFTDAREKGAQLTALQSRFTDMQKQAGALAEEVQKYKSLLEDERSKNWIAGKKLDGYDSLVKKVDEINLKLNKLSKAGKLVQLKNEEGKDTLVPESEWDANRTLLTRVVDNSKASFGGAYKGTCTMQPEKDCFKELSYRHITEIYVKGGPSLGRASGNVSLADLGSKLPYVEILHIENACIDSARGFENFESLRELNLLNCNVESAKGFEKIKNLKTLVLAGNIGMWNTEENTNYLGMLAQKGVEVIIEPEHYQKWCEGNR
jgi:predicted  nucleic acid-binding Zn-ribbon protein